MSSLSVTGDTWSAILPHQNTSTLARPYQKKICKIHGPLSQKLQTCTKNNLEPSQVKK